MLPREFAAYHGPAFERDEVRYNLILGLLVRLVAAEQTAARFWTLGVPGACAMQTSPQRSIILGALTPSQCRALADETHDLDYPGVIGLEDAPRLFVERATERGASFGEPIPQLLQALHDRPVRPTAPGAARTVTAGDVDLFARWLLAFFHEAVPHDPLPSRGAIEQTAASGNYQFWTVYGEPVAMAGIVRRLRHAAAIAGVYTPPALRRRGCGGAVIAAVVERVFAEGRGAACLFSDLRNPASNRCYAKVGFKPVCRSWHYLKA